MACKKGQFDVVQLNFSINLIAQLVNGMTPFDLALGTVIRYTLKYVSLSTFLCSSRKIPFPF